ncbi:MAG: twin-arginine translocase subunit TatC [Myxococcota bacterium]|jgi:sec-independent protein translocase protein TatC|nr:twin-arginine translocase subunit TatC [Myxococcota bacterium]HON24938.1 twin-arginine translocase subunit TatC [Myxococcota bacterium]HOS61313.1 twin-arginine translocase subunit TatC [Myxococcota bacterium]HPC92478.1 twin-arginine translocase subunit TatC [Myxococcota bacterium]HPL24480.1 twin-arginine translocase subunit TatC [Myxococcota bacterium]
MAKDQDQPMTFTEHLGELRNRLIKSVVGVIIGFAVAYSAHEHVFQAVARPILTALRNHGIPALQALQVTETITVYLQLSLIVGIFLASPYIIWQIWAFVAPGLLERERRVVVPIVGGIAAFFVLGVVFCYFVFLPMVADFLVGFTLRTGDISLIPTVQKTFGLTVIFLGVFGLAFQLPLLIFFLTLMGLVTHKKLLAFGRYFVVLAFIIGAILTPADPLSQTLMAVPLTILYLVGIVFSWVAGLMKTDQDATKVKVILALVFLAFAAAIGTSAWLWQKGMARPSTASLFGPNTILAARLDSRTPVGNEALRHVKRGFSNAELLPGETVVSQERQASSIYQKGHKDCVDLVDEDWCLLAGSKPLKAKGLENIERHGLKLVIDSDSPASLFLAKECLSRFVQGQVPDWMVAIVAPSQDGSLVLQFQFEPGDATQELVQRILAKSDELGPKSTSEAHKGANTVLDDGLERIAAWARGELIESKDGFSVMGGPGLIGRMLGEFALAAVSRCRD